MLRSSAERRSAGRRPGSARPRRGTGTRRRADLARLCATLLVALLGSGCFGLVGVVRGTADYSFSSPQLSGKDGGSWPATAEYVDLLLGPPDRTLRFTDGRELWTYSAGIRLHGVALLLGIVPVPLLVPTGENRVHLLIEEGRLVRVTGRTNATRLRVGCLVGAPFPSDGRRGCFAGRGGAPVRVFRRGPVFLWQPPPIQHAAPDRD